MKILNQLHRLFHWQFEKDDQWIYKRFFACGLTVPWSKRQNLTPILNEFFDIRHCPPAKGARRKLQLANVQLLRVFDAICKKHGLPYFLAYGTLLGAVRHKGFIPWDDDIDVMVPMEQYDEFVKILQAEIAGTELMLVGVENVRLGCATLRLTLRGCEYVNLDVFYSYCFSCGESDWKRVDAIWKRVRWSYYINIWELEKKCSKASLDAFRLKIDNMFSAKVGGAVPLSDPAAKTLIMPFSYPSSCPALVEDVLPLTTVSFEGDSYPAPRNAAKYLEGIYGDIYSFPSNLNHHGDAFMGFTDGEIDAATKRLEDVYKRLLSKGSDGSEA